MRSRLKSGGLGLALMLIVSGCETKAPVYRYQIHPPMLTVAPIYHECDIREDATGKKERSECVTLLRYDYRQIVLDLKMACLASGGTAQECQAE